MTWQIIGICALFMTACAAFGAASGAILAYVDNRSKRPSWWPFVIFLIAEFWFAIGLVSLLYALGVQ